MIFSSLLFIYGFLPTALFGFFLACRLSPRAGRLWLIVTSLGFYAAWRFEFLPLLLVSIAVNYGVGLTIVRTMKRPRMQNAVFLAGLAFDLAALGYYKYAVAIFTAFGLPSVAGIPYSHILLPLGISFFTFTQIGYLVDIKQGTTKNRNATSYVLFVTFFPHLIAGPILHNREMMPQFADPATYRLKAENLAIGFTIFTIGLLKKVLLADRLSGDVGTSFSAAGSVGMLGAWYGVVAYSMQLYFDFSGYSDMAIGLARLFNIRFPLNFNSPYKATSVIEFWQRWHMTLTRFITMYIFSPLALAATRARAARGLEGGRAATTSAGGFSKLILVLTMITMGLAGVWHGAGLQFLIFGLLHGIYIVINHAGRVFFPNPKDRPSRPWSLGAAVACAKVCATYAAVLVSFCFFRADSTPLAFGMLAGMCGLHGLGAKVPLDSVLQLLPLFVIVWALPNTQQIMSRVSPAIGRIPANPYAWLTWQPTRAWAVAGAALAALGLVAMGGPTEFLYFQF